uniref:Uncharacterized protein n=1 Tax=viral metagenome TaxID=1070528 RepID=A0A6M3II93_9ZZZZ
MRRKFDGAYVLKRWADAVATEYNGSVYEGRVPNGELEYFVLREELWPGELDNIHYDVLNLVRSLRRVKETEK